MIGSFITFILKVIGIEIINIIGGILFFLFKDSKVTEYENEHEVLIILGGIVYWILKIITYPIFYKFHKAQKQKIKQRELFIKIMNNSYEYKDTINSIINYINKLKESINGDLYSRVKDAYNDMERIIVKCSDGEGKLDIKEFENEIHDTIKECEEIVDIAWREYNDRIKHAKHQYYDSKKDEVRNDLESMRNKNREFKNRYDE